MSFLKKKDALRHLSFSLWIHKNTKFGNFAKYKSVPYICSNIYFYLTLDNLRLIFTFPAVGNKHRTPD